MKRLVATAVVVSFVAPLLAQGPLVFRKVDYFYNENGDEKDRDARFELDPVNRILRIAHEDDGSERETYAEIPYDAITKMVYERAAHRRYTAAVLVNPLFLFSRGKKHWLTIEFSDIDALPQGFVYVRMDKDNFRRILAALEAGTGMEVEELVEEGKD